MDYAQYRRMIQMDDKVWGDKSGFRLFLTTRVFRLIRFYRWTKYFQDKRSCFVLYQFCRIFYHRLCVKCGCDIPSHATIGGGFKLIHPNGIVINSKAVIGDNVTMLSGALIGSNHTGVPTVGDNVYIGAHALVIGNVHIGNNATIGAGAIVTHDVPDNAVAICDAAHIIRKDN